MTCAHCLNPILSWCGEFSDLEPTYLLMHSGNTFLPSMDKMVFLFTHHCPVLIGTKAIEEENRRKLMK